MPPDQPPQPADQLTTAVLAVLAGTPTDQAAHHTGLEVREVEDAAATYHAAGRAALEQRAERDWYQVNVEFPRWDLAETTAVTQIAPRLDQL
jgi:hypothetical protein